jgi:hypothetical protein
MGRRGRAAPAAPHGALLSWPNCPGVGRYGRVPLPDLDPLPVTRFNPSAVRRGKGGPEAHPVGTRSAIPAPRRRRHADPGGERQLCPESGERGTPACLVRSQSATSPQYDLIAALIGQRRQTAKAQLSEAYRRRSYAVKRRELVLGPRVRLRSIPWPATVGEEHDVISRTRPR